jgi:hypothetical protein
LATVVAAVVHIAVLVTVDDMAEPATVDDIADHLAVVMEIAV